MFLLGKGHVKARIRPVNGILQRNRVVVARHGPPDDPVAEGKSAVESVAFNGMPLVVEPDFELLVRHGGSVFPYLKVNILSIFVCGLRGEGCDAGIIGAGWRDVLLGRVKRGAFIRSLSVDSLA